MHAEHLVTTSAVYVTEQALSPLVRSADAGDPAATRQLYALLYDELKRMARRELNRSGGGLSLSASALLHETFLKLSRREELVFPDRGRFMAYASRAMRGLVIDYARSRHAQKRGGEFQITSLPTDVLVDWRGDSQSVDADMVERLGSAVEQLAAVDPALAELVDMKYFAGMSFVEIAALRDVTERTVHRHWLKARIFLYNALDVDAGDDANSLPL